MRIPKSAQKVTVNNINRSLRLCLKKGMILGSCMFLSAGLMCGIGGDFDLISTAKAANGNGFDISTQSRWRYRESEDYRYAKGSPSQNLSLRETIPHHTLGIKLNRSLTDSFDFKAGCLLQSATPLFELRVNSLDIRLFDSLNSFVFARFVVDDNQEFSLRGELASSNRIVFAPITRSQERAISDLYLQMREGGVLNIALLQGNGPARVYSVPLAGFISNADRLLESCTTYHSNYKGNVSYLPDYVTKEPSGYAPKNYSLLDMSGEVVDPNALQVELPEPKPVEVPKVEEAPKPQEVIPFTPGGGPVSIGPDGLPVGVNNGQGPQPLGTASGPMQIGPDGNPIPGGAAPSEPNKGDNKGTNGVDIF